MGRGREEEEGSINGMFHMRHDTETIPRTICTIHGNSSEIQEVLITFYVYSGKNIFSYSADATYFLLKENGK